MHACMEQGERAAVSEEDGQPTSSHGCELFDNQYFNMIVPRSAGSMKAWSFADQIQWNLWQKTRSPGNVPK